MTHAALLGWLVVWWFLLGLVLGSFVISMIHRLTGGEWGVVLAAPLARIQRLLPIVLALSLPLWLGMSGLFPWMSVGQDVGAPAADASWYLNRTAFVVRELACFAAWLALAHVHRRWAAVVAVGAPSAARERRTTPTRDEQRLRRLAAGGLLVYAVTVTIAAVDWVMSLVPPWTSTTFGMLVATGQTLGAFALAVALAARVGGWDRNSPARLASDAAGTATVTTARTFGDLGNLLLMLVMLWAYLAYTQYLIIWAEDLPREIAWYLPRVQTGWRYFGAALVAAQFGVPFALLLSRAFKRSPRRLGALAAWLVVAHLADTIWLIVPGAANG